MRATPVPSTPSTRAVVRAIAPLFCAAVSFGTFEGFELFVRHNLAPQKAVSFLIGVMGEMLPWVVGLYFAYATIRESSRLLRAVGAMGLLILLTEALMLLRPVTR